MPPRRSRRLRRPSTQALESLAGSPRPRLWRDHTPGLNVTQVQSGSGLNIVAVPPGSGLNVPSVPSGSGLNAAAVPPGTVPPLVPLAPAAPPTLPQPVALPPELIAQLVTLVTTEVTKNIQAMLPTTAVISRSQQQNNGPNQTKTQSCTELPVVDAITEAGDTVQQVVNSAHSTLSATSRVKSADTLQVKGFKSNQILAADLEVIQQCRHAAGEKDPSLACCRMRPVPNKNLFKVRDRFLPDRETPDDCVYQFPQELSDGMVHAYFERENDDIHINGTQLYEQMERHESELS
ncbi:hypothetical protein OS493_012922 [Desmophyllum pertusum]|uniref:Uncharacterized protein n=1 Tax=Desmophyllum pertusum TaxID=174260 RepID=A0A9X0CS03_9CNID|nr:hypothetical protein OS493_012922 [Desmophyllum pertusum]